MIKPPLSVGYGYGIVLGLGFLFAFGMMLITWILRRYNNELQTSELFSTAGRTVKSGLVASAVVSSWTWAATLLTSSGVTYRYGVSGPLWYASGATVQILWFATLAIELKRRAPNAHTFLEVIRARYGTYTHIVFIVFGLMTNILVTAMLLSGGSAVVTSLTGMPTAAACFLLPVGVVMYTLFGGIKATFLTDYVHTFTILIIIFIFALTVYATSPILGSPGAVWELLQKAALEHPVAGNAQGSYLTMQSREGIIFFVINIAGNFGTVFCDNVPDVTRFFIHRIKFYSAPDLQKGYYNKAIAAHPVSALPGYIMGGLSWFAIPWLCATTMGLSALALEGNPAFPTYPNRLSDAQVSAGLVLPNAAVALLGQGGAICTLLMVFMAVTSASSAELIAVSTIFTYDIYQTYFDPEAPGHRLIYVAHASVIGFGIFMAGFATALFYIGISMTYLYLMMGVIVSSAVIPATLTLMWKRQNVVAATATPILGLFCSLTAWLVTAKRESGSLSVASTYANNPMLAGNVVALLSPVLFVPILTYAFGENNYDYKSMESIRRGDDSGITAEASIDLELVPGTSNPREVLAPDEKAMLKHASKTAKATTAGMTLVLLILWPIPLYASGYVFSKRFFTGWVVAGIMWLFFSFCCVGLFPLWQGRQGLIATFKAIKLDFNTSREARNPHSDNRRGPGHRESLDLSIDS